MPDYQLFGGCFRSELPFPELTPSHDAPAPRWVLTTSDGAPAVSSPVELGREDVEPGVQVALTRHERGLRLTFDDTGAFDISTDGTRVEWTRPADPDLESVRKDVLGRVLAVCLHLQGVVALHGSAVAIAGKAIAFLAPKFHGKSTTAAALVDCGGRLLADDLVAVSTGAVPEILPSVPCIQLWKDSAARVAPGAVPVTGNADGMKLQRRWTTSEHNAATPTPLAAIYLLAPVAPGGPDGVRRIRLSAVEGALALIGQAKVGNLLGVTRRAELLLAAGELADGVPIYRLRIPRDFDRLPDLTGALWNWHAASESA